MATGIIDTERRSVRAVTLLLAACLALLSCSIFSLGAIFSLHVIAVALLMQFINFIVKCIGKSKYKNGFAVWKKIYGSGIVPVIVAVAMMVFGFVNMNNIVETDYTVYTQKNIREQGYTVALIADVHFGVSVDITELKSICNDISKKNVDIVVLCGDIVDENTTASGMREVFAALGGITSNYGVFYVYGNHDRQPYTDDKTFGADQLRKTIEDSGITILSDEVYAVNDELVIVGREDRSYGKTDRKSIADLISDVDRNKFILTVDHQPTEYKENGQAGTDLLLSGHTHGGQIWPANIIFDLFGLNDAVYGYTRINKTTQAIVTSGLAGWGFPVKTVAPAEYVIIKIKGK
ncbi:MAG: metallophosphoesterase [Clostridiales bacterium]|nr:metallophosphoesterase [Clostridiales bacterium]